MRFVQKNLEDPPQIFKEQSTLRALEDIARTKDTTKIKDDVYKGSYKNPTTGKSESAVRDKLNEYYLSKCAYCEAFCKAEIEHYRPKKGITEDSNHEGYYWLCYEWSNLVPSCRYCNTEGGKGNQFPIKGVRVNLPNFDNNNQLDKTKSRANAMPLKGELPYLLHPEIENNLNTFLGFEIDSSKKGIAIKGLDGVNERGEQTIKICNLNREYLKFDRFKNVVFVFIDSIQSVFDLVSEGILPKSKLKKALWIQFKQMSQNKEKIDLTHTLLRNFIIQNTNNFNQIIIPLLEETQKQIVSNAFISYKNNNP